jgi:DNA-binding MarR family transcriptional regulator
VTSFKGGPQDSPGYLLWHATLRWQRMITAALAPLDLSHEQFVLLTCLWWMEEQGDDRPNQLTLAQQAGTDVKMTSQVLRTLERKGLIERRVNLADTRAKTVRLSGSGRRLARKAVGVVESTDKRFFAPAVKAASTDQVVQMLQRISQLDG